MKVEDYTERKQEIDGWPVHIVTYRVGDKYYCSVDNVTPARGLRAPRARRAKTPSESPSKRRSVT